MISDKVSVHYAQFMYNVNVRQLISRYTTTRRTPFQVWGLLSLLLSWIFGILILTQSHWLNWSNAQPQEHDNKSNKSDNQTPTLSSCPVVHRDCIPRSFSFSLLRSWLSHFCFSIASLYSEKNFSLSAFSWSGFIIVLIDYVFWASYT